MRILVVSDTHGNWLAPLQCITGIQVDLIIHLGDLICDARDLEKVSEAPVIMVPGNCDPDATEPRELCHTFKGHKFLLSHGDNYRVKAGYELLLKRAKETGAAVALCGHTHVPLVQKSDGILLINPGTLMAASSQKSCAILHVSISKVTAEIIHLP
ncbi:MAG: YfcE family phosphodiesterase [Geobacter sp.]|nr:YfcE family phosphodiesterase [Geobacter sp.]